MARSSIGKTPLEIVDEAMQKTLVKDEYIEHEARIMHIYRMLSMSDPDMPDTDEPVDAREALAGPLKDKYLEAIRSEWENLRKKTLEPVSKQELERYVSNGNDYEKIGLTMKTKMKLKPDGTLDKFKGRGAGRGDQWVRQRAPALLPGSRRYCREKWIRNAPGDNRGLELDLLC